MSKEAIEDGQKEAEQRYAPRLWCKKCCDWMEDSGYGLLECPHCHKIVDDPTWTNGNGDGM